VNPVKKSSPPGHLCVFARAKIFSFIFFHFFSLFPFFLTLFIKTTPKPYYFFALFLTIHRLFNRICRFYDKSSFSPNTSAVNKYTSVSDFRHASPANKALLAQQLRKNSSLLQPVSVATCGRKHPARPPFFT
jgi:hypothetical protein